jgi:hypothetical protein
MKINTKNIDLADLYLSTICIPLQTAMRTSCTALSWQPALTSFFRRWGYSLLSAV